MIWKLWPIYLFKENEKHSTKAFVLHWLIFTGFTTHQLILLNEQLCKLMWKFYVLFSIRTNFAEHGEKSYL